MRYLNKTIHFNNPWIERGILISAALLLFLLLLKNPFSDRTLIPNLEPHPDTFHYISPARNLALGEGFTLEREGRVLPLRVPPLYSAVLSPFYLINSDARVFYFANVLLSFIYFFFFYLILKRLQINQVIRGFILIILVTTYQTYWFPALAMAENLILPLYTICLYLLLNRLDKKRIILSAILTLAFFAAKYASVPLLLTFLAAFVSLIFRGNKEDRKNLHNLLIFIATFTALFLSYVAFEYLYNENKILEAPLQVLQYYKNSIFPDAGPPDFQTRAASTSGFFSIGYLQSHLPIYLKSLMGGRIPLLWDSSPLITNYVGLLGLFGLSAGLFFRKLKLISSVVMISTLASFLFISTLYVVDARYIMHVIPGLLIGAAIALNLLLKAAVNKKIPALFYLLFSILAGFYLYSHAYPIRYQIALNIKYAESPWHYLSIVNINEYFDKTSLKSGKKPVIISGQHPFLFDYYSENKYEILPLSYDQEFRKQKEIVWGNYDYSDLNALYDNFLTKNRDVYVSAFFPTNEIHFRRDMDLIKMKFNLSLVKEGCYGSCNLYKLEHKKE